MKVSFEEQHTDCQLIMYDADISQLTWCTHKQASLTCGEEKGLGKDWRLFQLPLKGVPVVHVGLTRSEFYETVLMVKEREEFQTVLQYMESFWYWGKHGFSKIATVFKHC